MVVGVERDAEIAACPEIRERILRVQLPMTRDHDSVLEVPFREYVEQADLLSLETVRAGVLQEVVYSVVLKANAHPRKLIEAIRAHNEGHKVTLVIGKQEIDI